MPITIGSNIASLQTARALDRVGDDLSTTLQRLGSGTRINRASDDAAGLAVSSTLNAKSRVFTQGVRNISDTVSLLDIAEGATASLMSITQRLQELAEQASNSLYSGTQRRAFQTEADAAVAEFRRIIEGTQFNGVPIFSPQTPEVAVQAGFDTMIADLSPTETTGTGDFGSGSLIGLGAAPSSVVARDINFDGRMDLISSNNGNFSVLLGNGNGTFKTQASYSGSGGSSFGQMSVEDLNSDGAFDVVIGGYGTSTVDIFLANRDLTYGPKLTVNTSAGVEGVDIADVNNDGYLDVGYATTNGQAFVMLGNGNGTFKASATVGGGNFFTDIAFADFNGDNRLDASVVDLSAGQVRIFGGNGDGTFAALTPLTAPYGGAGRQQVGDLNNDGVADIIAGGWSGSAASDLQVFIANGNGTFKAAVSYATGQAPYGLALADMNGDGSLDAITGAIDVNRISVFLNKGDGTFQTAITRTSSGSYPQSITIGDFNGDGANDIIAGQKGSGVLELFQGVTQSRDVTLAMRSFRKGELQYTTVADAREALAKTKGMIDFISRVNATVGTSRSRLTVAMSVLSSMKELSAAAVSRIVDADIAEESAELVRKKIVQQSATSILSQANMTPSLVLALLRP